MARINTHLGARRRNQLRTFGQLNPLGTGPHAEALFGGYLPEAATPDPPASHASESAGYHYDAAVPGGGPGRTPVVAPEPSQAAQGPAGDYAGARRAYTRAIKALPPPIAALSPPLAPAGAAVAGQVGRAAATDPLGLLTSGLQALLAPPTPPAVPKPGSPESMILSSDPAKPAHMPVDPADPLGKKTLGDVTAAELAAAGEAGTLQLNAGGKLTTPGVRSTIAELKDAQKQYAATARPDLTGLSAEERALIPYVLKSHREYPDIPISVQMAQIKQESGFNPNAVSSAGAFGATQFIPSTAESYGVERGDSPAAIQSQVSGQAHLLHDDNFASDPQGALSAYSGGYAAADYNNPILTDAKASYGALDKPTHPDPQAAQALRVAKQHVRADGLNPVAFNGDVTGGGANTVTVRADAKGMVNWAESALGQHEGSPKTMRWGAKFGLDPTTQPWCANFVSNGLLRRGVTDLPSNPNYVPTYESEWANYAVPGGLADAKPGDLVTFSGSHIGIYVGNGEMVSGNSSDAVSRTPVGSPSMVIRPPYKGGKVTIEESAALPGSTASSALGSSTSVAVGSPSAAAGSTGTATGRPALAPLTALANPTAAGPVLPEVPGVGVPDEHVASAAQNLLTLLGEEEGATGRPTL